MNNLVLYFLMLCITGMFCVTGLAIFCYKQDQIRLIFKSKNRVTKDGFTSDMALDIDKSKKENSR